MFLFLFLFFFFGIHKHSKNRSTINSCVTYITTRTHIIRVAKQNNRTIDNEVYEIPSNPQVGEERKDLKTNYQKLKETENHCPLVFQNILNSRHVKEVEAEGVDNGRNQNKMDKVHEECLLNGYKLR